MALKRITVNSAWLLAARLLGQGLALGTTALVARKLGQAGLGEFAFIAALLYLGNVITTFGVDTLLIKEIASNRDTLAGHFSAALWLQIVLSTGWNVMVWLFPWARYGLSPEAIQALRITSFALFPLAFYTVSSAALRGKERMDLFTLASLVFPGGQVVGTILVIAAGYGLPGLAWVIVVSQVIGALIAFLLCQTFLEEIWEAFHALPNFKFTNPFRIYQSIVVQALPYALLTILAVATQRLGVLTLTFLDSSALTGLYSAPARVVEAARLAPVALLGTLLPALARLSSDPADSPEAGRLDRTARHSLLGFGLLVTAGTLLLAQPVLGWLFGSAFIKAAPALRILSFTLIPFAFSSTRSILLLAQGYASTVLKANLTGFTLSLIFYAILVPSQGLTGAALASLLAEVVIAIALWAMSPRSRPLPGATLRFTRIKIVD